MGYFKQVGLETEQLAEIEKMQAMVNLIRVLPQVEQSLNNFVAKYPQSQALTQWKSAKDTWLPLPAGWAVIRADSKSRTAVRYSPLKTEEKLKALLKTQLPGIIGGALLGFMVGRLIPIFVKGR